MKNETVPEGGKVASGELDISRDSEVNMSRDVSLHNSSRLTGLDSSALHFVNGKFEGFWRILFEQFYLNSFIPLMHDPSFNLFQIISDETPSKKDLEVPSFKDFSGWAKISIDQ